MPFAENNMASAAPARRDGAGGRRRRAGGVVVGDVLAGDVLAAPGQISPVILSGGAGARLWPTSRESLPKQFIPLFGGETTFQRIARLTAGDPMFGPAVVLTSRAHAFLAQEQLRAAGVRARLALEPVRRDTAAAVAVAVELAMAEHPAPVLGVFASDHAIGDAAAFRAACALAAPAAAAGQIVTFGVPPAAPSVAYGYILPGAEIAPGVRRALAFTEKPGPDLAARLVAEGRLWNSGNFIFRADVMREELARFAPDILAAAQAAVAAARAEPAGLALGEALAAAPARSIDVAVMERTRRAAVVEARYGWRDLGGWRAVWELAEKDDSGNAVHGDAIVLDGRNNLVRCEEPGGLACLIGVEGLVVVTAGDVTLVAPHERAGETRELVRRLQAMGAPAARRHRTTLRPWGAFTVLDAGAGHVVKRMSVRPGGVLSLQKHLRRAEHWVVTRGVGEAWRDGERFILRANDWFHVPAGAVHRLANRGAEPLELVEVQVGAWCSEDDIVRLDDVYGRVHETAPAD